MDNMQKIPVFFTFDANYLLAAKVAIHSMMKHASRQYWYELYVFHTTLSPKAQQSLRNSLKEFTHTELHFIDVTQYNEKIKNFGTKAHYSKEIFYKLIATDVLPQYDRIICSDVDVVFTRIFHVPERKILLCRCRTSGKQSYALLPERLQYDGNGNT